MCSAVSNFVKNAATSALKWVAKTGTSFILGKVPVIGTPLADWLNSRYKHGGKVHRYADGGAVMDKLHEEGIKTQVINTPAQLIAAIKKFPEEAKKAGLTVGMIKEAKDEKVGNVVSKPVEEASTEAESSLKRGGRKHHGHVVEVPCPSDRVVPKAHHKKRAHKRKHHAAEEEGMAHGGLKHPAVASLPYSDLDRLDMPVHARGGMHHMDVGLCPGEHEQSYVQLHHEHRGHHPGHHGHHPRVHGHHGHHGHHLKVHGLHGHH